MLQADKLLLHLPSAVRAYFFAHALFLGFRLVCIFFLFLFPFRKSILRNPRFITWQTVKIQAVYFIKGSLFCYSLYPLVDLPRNFFTVLSFRQLIMLPVLITGLFKQTVCYFSFQLLL